MAEEYSSQKHAEDYSAVVKGFSAKRPILVGWYETNFSIRQAGQVLTKFVGAGVERSLGMSPLTFRRVAYSEQSTFHSIHICRLRRIF